MSDNKKDKSKGEGGAGTPEKFAAGDLPVSVLTQYVRDISFENPNAPDSLRGGLGAPELDVNIGMDARKLPDDSMKNLYEVVLNARAEAKRGSDVVFIAEVQYGMVVNVGDMVPEENHHPLLLIEIPRLSFPFVRQILADLTTQGGYPPLLLGIVDFHALYMQRFGKEIDEYRKKMEEGAKKGS
ncbi:MAG: protein-export chaperone SecB [Alphaproteobacteria bacterium]|nr:protein-export chaperone SecB [Alphaproteobacteria bacterium]